MSDQKNTLYDAPLATKIAWTFFLVFTLAALAFSVWRVTDAGTATARGIGATYGAEPIDLESNETPAAGPTLDLPDDPAMIARPARSKGEMIVVAHVHAFMIPAVLYLVTLIFLRAGLASSLNVMTIVIANLAVAIDLSSIGLVRYVSTAFAPLVMVGGIAMTGSFLFMIGAALIAIWHAPGEES
ncbi:hypothetical protein K8I61_08740 [bacterium]|nr:hypothetical protein [bacterium]